MATTSPFLRTDDAPPPKLIEITGLPEIDEKILGFTDFLTAVMCGCTTSTGRELYGKSQWTVDRIQRFNYKCTHRLRIGRQLFHIDPTCDKERDPRTLSEKNRFHLYRFLHHLNYDIRTHDLNKADDKILRDAFDICDCKFARMRLDEDAKVPYFLATTYRLFQIGSRLGDFFDILTD